MVRLLIRSRMVAIAASLDRRLKGAFRYPGGVVDGALAGIAKGSLPGGEQRSEYSPKPRFMGSGIASWSCRKSAVRALPSGVARRTPARLRFGAAGILIRLESVSPWLFGAGIWRDVRDCSSQQEIVITSGARDLLPAGSGEKRIPRPRLVMTIF